MRALFDVNVLIALIDPEHVFHDSAHEWWHSNREMGWASTPLTENGAVRITASQKYPGLDGATVEDVLLRLSVFAENSNHEFWSDEISITDQKLFDPSSIYSSRHLTDLYLLALATKRGGRLITFDRRIQTAPVRLAKKHNIFIIDDNR